MQVHQARCSSQTGLAISDEVTNVTRSAPGASVLRVPSTDALNLLNLGGSAHQWKVASRSRESRAAHEHLLAGQRADRSRD
jgi:hypothetical protein